MGGKMHALVGGLVALLGGAPLLAAAQDWDGSGRGDRPSGRSFATRSPVIAPRAVAATTNPLATSVAIEVLREGGSAIDAAIAANAVLGVVEPMMTGPGGDLFAIVWDPKTRRAYGFNGSGRSAATLTLDRLRQQLGPASEMPSRGPHTVTVPGAVDAWFRLHARFGRLPMERLLEPAIQYARSGFPVSQHAAYAWSQISALLTDQPEDVIHGLRGQFTIEGRAPREGERMFNAPMARTLALIGKKGREAFYAGEIARQIEALMVRTGGALRASDLRSHAGEWVDPVSTTYRGHEVLQLPPNTQGIAVLQALNILEGYDIRSMGFGSAAFAHVLTEALKLTFEDRAKFYSDPLLEQIPVSRLLSKDYASERRALIRNDQARASPTDPAPEDAGETTYLTVADHEGMMVSLISSVYSLFGSGMVPPELGFALQNRGAAFNLEREHPNSYSPRKRPFHTIIPGFVVKDKQPLFSFGMLGGDMQPQGQVQIIVNLIDFGMNVQEAGDAARLRYEGDATPSNPRAGGGTGQIYLESGYSEAVAAELKRKGHKVMRHVKVPVAYFGGYQGVLRDPRTGMYVAGSEMRMDGQAAGF